MSRIRGHGNKDTEIALAKLLRRCHITGWRRQQKLLIEGGNRRTGPFDDAQDRPARTTNDETGGRRARRSRPTKVGVDFIFPRQRVAVFVDGCFWHGCPIHSSPRKWIKRSSMGMEMRARNQRRGRETCAERERRDGSAGASPSQMKVRTDPSATLRTGPSATLRTGKAFWGKKMAANMARDRFVNRVLRRQGWKVVRIWEHEIMKHPDRSLHRIRAHLCR